jgi:hypothetical protein
VPGRRVSTRKLREVMRLRFELIRATSKSAKLRDCGEHSVQVPEAEEAGVTWPLPESSDDARGEEALFPRSGPPASEPTPAHPKPDFVSIHEQLRQHRHLTLQLLWEEYRQVNPDGNRYSHLCELYQRWRTKLDVVLRLEHNTGEKMFVDWAVQRFRFTTGIRVKLVSHRRSWPRWARVRTPGPRPRATHPGITATLLALPSSQ